MHSISTTFEVKINVVLTFLVLCANLQRLLSPYGGTVTKRGMLGFLEALK